ncbi:hypothetical protein BJ742DRAFT_178015 [Cladochytrium replicatum]|nr:hypothetical protein BJ742DRAFT_178015 [Cladochytrium replicatum]
MAPTDGKDGAWASGIAFLRGIFGTWSWPKAQNTLKAALSFALCFAIVGVPPSEFVRKYIGAYPVYIVFTNLLIHPARTVGSMVEQFIVTIVFLILAAIVIFAAQASAYAFNVTIGGNIGGAIILAVWNFVFIAYGSWLRLVIPRWNNPLLTIVALIALSLTKESTSVTYSWRLVVDGVVPYVLGLTASLLVNVLLFPQTASNALKVSLRKSLGDIETAVKELTQCFTFNKPGNQKGVPEMAALVRTVRASLKTLSNTTLESSHELSYSEFSPSEIKVMTKSFWTMLTHLAAMESCIEIERTLVSDQDIAEAKKERSKAGGSHLDSFMNPMSESPSTDPDLTGGFASSGSGHTAGKAIDARTRVFQSVTDMPAVSALKQIGDKNVVIDFVLGPAGESIRALAGAASDSLSRISHFVLNDGTKQQRRGSVAHFVSGSATRPYPGESVTAYLDRMIDAFDQAQVEWMTSIAWDLRAPSRTLAQKKSLPLMTPTDVTKHYFSDDFDSDPFSTRAAHGGTSSDSNRTPYREEYFLASFFVFSLREFAQEVRNLAEKVERILNRRDAGYDPTEGTGSVRSVNIHMSGDSITIGKYWWIPDLRIDRWLRTGGDAGYQANFSTMPQGLPRRTFSSRLINFFVDVGASFQTHEVRFGIKFAVAFLILSWPTYVFPTEYSKVRGDSAMITLFVVLSPTVGGSLSTSIFRIFGTIAGAVFGFIVWRIAPGNPVVGSVGALVFSLPWWWVLFSAPAYARLGINALLTFGLVMIIAQTSIPPLSPDAFLNMALFTELMVVVGVIVALIVTAQVWPFLAGKELRLSISRTLQDLGFLYGKLVVTFFEGKDGTAIRAKHAHTPESPSDWAVKANLKAGSTSTADLGVYPMDSYPSSKPAKKVGDREKAVPAAPPESPEPSALHTVSLKRLVKKVRVALDTERELIQLALNEPHLSRKFPADLYTRVVESMVVLLDRMVSVAHILGSADDDGEIGRKKRRAKGLKDKRPSGVWSRHVVQQAIEPTRKTRQDMVCFHTSRLWVETLIKSSP